MPIRFEVQRSIVVAQWCLGAFVNLIILPLRLLLRTGVLPLACVAVLLLAVVAQTPAVFNYFTNLLSNQLVRFATFYNPTLAPVTYFCCNVLAIPFVCPKYVDKPLAVRDPKTTQRSVSTSTKLASDIFQSVISLGNACNLDLRQGDIIGLAIAVQHASELEKKEELAGKLRKLANLTRELKDEVIGLNSQGINTFSFIAQEFSRLQNIVDLVRAGDSPYTSRTVSSNLDRLFDQIAYELSRIESRIKDCISLASRSADQEIAVASQISEERTKLLKLKASTPFWRRVIEGRGWEAKQLVHDLALTSESLQAMNAIWNRLEELRLMLVAYEHNVKLFKDSLLAYHKAHHQILAEDEVESMSGIIDSFTQTVEASKSSSSGVKIPQLLDA